MLIGYESDDMLIFASISPLCTCLVSAPDKRLLNALNGDLNGSTVAKF